MNESIFDEPKIIPTSDERILAILAHVLTPIAWLLPPLIIYLLKKDDSKFVAAHAKESLNFQLTVSLVCILLVLSVLGVFLLWAVGVVVLVFVILAAVRASEGSLYQYPVSIRFIR